MRDALTERGDQNTSRRDTPMHQRQIIEKPPNLNVSPSQRNQGNKQTMSLPRMPNFQEKIINFRKSSNLSTIP